MTSCSRYLRLIKLSLPRLAAVTWASNIALLAVMAGLLWSRVWHPHFLPIVCLLAVIVVCALLLVSNGIWQIARGPNRIHSAGWLLVGSAPLLLLAGQFCYGLTVGSGRLVRLNVPLKLLIPLGESIMDLEARLHYPQRTAGERVVMISTPVDNAKQQVAAMDEHVCQLEKLLGRTIDGRIHWVRGPLLGMRGKAILGICMGSLPGEGTVDADGLTTLDRHEVAHCVINRFTTPASEPPALLIEGWAEGHSGISDEVLAARLWDERRRGQDMSLIELVGDDWQARHEWPVYVHGAPLVRYLLRTYGAEKFLELYVTSQRADFAADCQRILGVTLAELNTAFWQDIERIAAGRDSSQRNMLTQFDLSPSVSRGDWLQFAEEFAVAAARMRAQYDQVRQVVEVITTTRSDSAPKEIYTAKYTMTTSGPNRLLQIERASGEEVFLANPVRSLRARRMPNAPWQVVTDTTDNAARSYRQQSSAIDSATFWIDLPAIFSTDRLRWGGKEQRPLVRRFERLDTAKGRRVRIELDSTTPSTGSDLDAQASLEFACDNEFALQSFAFGKQQQAHGQVEYDLHNDVPMLKALTTVVKDTTGQTESTTTTRVIECSFEPSADEQFTAEAVVGSAAHAVEPLSMEAPHAWHWYQLPLYGSAVSLAVGLMLLNWPSRSRGADWQTPVELLPQ